MWDDFVRGISSRYDWPCYTAEGIMESYHHTRKRLVKLEGRFKKTPISTKGGKRPLQPATIRQLEKERESLIQSVASYQKFIKVLVKKNMLPASKLISGEDRKQFIFSLWTMLELPELGKVVFYANRLTRTRYDHSTPSTNDEYKQQLESWGLRKPGERSREEMYDALVDALNETLARIQRERERLIFSGEPWKAKETEPGLISEERGAEEIETQALNGLKVINGGLYEPPDVSIDKVGDILSDTFKAFRREQQAKTDNHENA